MSLFLLKAIKAATITLFIKHYIDDNGAEHIDIDQTLTGGIGGSTETRVLDWQEREHNDRIFGPVVGKARRIDLDEVMEEYLRNGWTDDTEEHGVIDAYARSNTSKSGKTWTSEQVNKTL